MLKSKYFIILIGVALIVTGIVGNSYLQGRKDIQSDNDSFFNVKGMMNSTIWSNNNNVTMMGNDNLRSYEKDYDKLTVEELEVFVNKYISSYETELEISDVFIYEDSEYYYSIIEKETGRGAMELLVNPFTGSIYPEYGPNMMWNFKYGMHGPSGMMSGRNMMSGRGMMGYNNSDFDTSDFGDNEITSEEAYNYGVKYLDKLNDELELSKEFHEFYGYFTFHVDMDGKTYGMMSVNGFTGDVWYHDWHGKLIEVIDGHGEDNH